MAFRSHLGSSNNTGGSRSSGGGTSTTYGRVVHVILSDKDPYYDNPSTINGVYYRILGSVGAENEIRRLPFAYQGSSTYRTIPLPGEIVKIENGAGPESLDNIGETVAYWKEIVNIWNHPHHGAGPDTTQQDWRDNLLKSFPEQKTINPLKANPGDTLIEGRLGQSIRLGGAQGETSLIDSTNTGKPVIVISNGQIQTKNGSELIEEDINEDFNSIYLLSDHKIPLLPANSKEDTYDTLPTAINRYKGNQVAVNGGRLVFNAKEDAILLKARQSIGLSGESVNLDANRYICLDSPKIYIGSRARTATESVRQSAVLGKQLETWLETLLNTLEILSSAMSSASAVGAGPVIELNTTGPVLKSTVTTLKSQLKSFQSKKVFIE
jgi:signal peptidase I